jgi:SAM-dependent methyltransferase
MKNTERFSDRVANYIRYRPHYPAAILPYLQKLTGLTNGWSIADIGSGTGISSQLFLSAGYKVCGIEPNKEMREAAEQLLIDEKNFTSIDATAENTILQNSSVDLIVAGQAFHWFDRDKAKEEFKRILKPGGWLVLIWNERGTGSPFQQDYEAALATYCPQYAEVNHRNIDPESLRQFYLPFDCSRADFENHQQHTLPEVKGRLLSSSYAPLEGHPAHHPLMEELERIFEKHNTNGYVTFDYNCNVYTGQLK